MSKGARTLLAAVLVLVAALAGCREAGPPPMRNAILIVIDTLRRDGLDHAETPAIDALIARGQLAPLAWSSDTWTGGSVVSLFSGRHVRDHGWITAFPGPDAEDWSPMPLLPDVPMLAEVLRDADFDTAGYYANRVLSWDLGWSRGFERWEFAPDAQIPDRVGRELAGWDDGRRHFLYLHFMGPHSPIRPSPAARKRWNLRAPVYAVPRTEAETDPEERARSTARLRRAYWAAIEDTDAQLAVILRLLDAHLEDTAIVLTSDHGELLGERERYGHGGGVEEALTRVPFVAVNTAPLPERFNNALAADLLTGALGVEHDWNVEAALPDWLVSQFLGILAISPDGQAKATWNPLGQLEVFDLAGYPQEQVGFEARRESLADMRSRFEREVEPGTLGPGRVSADEELQEALRALGYVGE